jgi:hypothetical protein
LVQGRVEAPSHIPPVYTQGSYDAGLTTLGYTKIMAVAPHTYFKRRLCGVESAPLPDYVWDDSPITTRDVIRINSHCSLFGIGNYPHFRPDTSRLPYDQYVYSCVGQRHSKPIGPKPEPKEPSEFTKSLLRLLVGPMWFERRKVISSATEKRAADLVSAELDDGFNDLEDNTDDFGVTEIEPIENKAMKRIKTHRRVPYETKILYLIREKFVPGTSRTDVNITAIRYYAIQLMTAQNVRLVDRTRVMESIIPRFFTPTEGDLRERELDNTRAMWDRRQEANRRYVDFNFQRFWGFGARTNTPRPAST